MSTPIFDFTPLSAELRRFAGWTKEDVHQVNTLAKNEQADPILRSHAIDQNLALHEAVLAEAKICASVMEQEKNGGQTGTNMSLI